MEKLIFGLPIIQNKDLKAKFDSISKDYNDLSKVMRDVYENYKDYRINSLIESEVIRRNFNWENAAEKGYEILKEIVGADFS